MRSVPDGEARELAGGRPGLDLGVGIKYNCSHRNFDIQIFAGFSRTFPAHPILAILRFIGSLVTKICKRVQPSIGNQVNVTTITAISAVRPAKGYIFFTTKTRTAVTTFAGSLYADYYSGLKHKTPHEAGF